MLESKEVKEKIRELGYMKKFVAQKIGITDVHFSYFLNDKRNLGKDAQKRLKKFLKL